uniref:Uncharacterized protein n=1 Tax=Rhizophora mucronata TaxID=61149 RepID=A0A2P2P4I2_RHIMU
MGVIKNLNTQALWLHDTEC